MSSITNVGHFLQVLQTQGPCDKHAPPQHQEADGGFRESKGDPSEDFFLNDRQDLRSVVSFAGDEKKT